MGAAKLFGLNSLALGLGQPTVPGPFGPVGGAGAEGRRGIKRWVQESPSVQPLITAAPPPPSQLPPPHPRPSQAPHLSAQGEGRSTWPCDRGQEVGPAGGRGAAVHPHPDSGHSTEGLPVGVAQSGRWVARGPGKTPLGGPDEAELVPRAGSPLWAEGLSLSPKRQALLGQ